MGHSSQTSQESEQTVRPGRSPLTSELLAPDKELTEVLDYEDVEENDPGVPDPVAHIPQADTFTDVEMQESQPSPGFEPEVSRSGYDVNLVRPNPTEWGRHPQLRQWKMRCWTERLPEPLDLAGRVPTKTPAVQRTINFRALFPKKTLSIHKDGLLPGV